MFRYSILKWYFFISLANSKFQLYLIFLLMQLYVEFAQTHVISPSTVLVSVICLNMSLQFRPQLQNRDNALLVQRQKPSTDEPHVTSSSKIKGDSLALNEFQNKNLLHILVCGSAIHFLGSNHGFSSTEHSSSFLIFVCLSFLMCKMEIITVVISNFIVIQLYKNL